MITRVKWTDEEWNLVCMELYKNNPNTAMYSQSLVGISKDDFARAMHKLIPRPRWRASINMTVIRPNLLERFKLIKIHIAVAEQAKLDESTRTAALVEEQLRAKSQSDIFAPMIKLMAEQLFAQLRPMLDQYMLDRQESALKATNDNGAVVSHHRKLEPVADRIRKPRVGIIGLIPSQQQEILKSYPGLDLSFVEDGNRTHEIKGKLSNMEVVFGLVAKMPHAAESTLRSMSVWANYQRISGKGRTSVIRALDHWLKDRK
jgi:hypothetical protein